MARKRKNCVVIVPVLSIKGKKGERLVETVFGTFTVQEEGRPSLVELTFDKPPNEEGSKVVSVKSFSSDGGGEVPTTEGRQNKPKK